MEGAVSEMTAAPTALVTLLCRTAADVPGSVVGVEELAALAGKRLGTEPRAIGSPAAVPEGTGYEEDLAASRGCLLEAGGQVEDALGSGRAPLLLAGDAAIALTTLPSLARDRSDAKVLYLCAGSSYASPGVDPGAGLAAMALAGACGEWDPGLGATPIDAANVVLCGVGQLPDTERESLERSAVTVIGASLETLVFTQNALDGAPCFVHLDLSVLDAIVPDKLYDLLEAVAGDCDVIGAEITGFAAPDDPEERQSAAAAALEAAEPVLEALTRARAKI